MTCQNVIDEYGNTCGDEGRACDKCSEAEMRARAYLAGMPRYMVCDDAQARAELNQELIEAGRGHLVRL
jgi:hypothetical protein